jgi:hypothetical protein
MDTVEKRVEMVAAMMTDFGDRTGLTSGAEPSRYLWTDAFAVCNYLALHRRTGQSGWLELARRLIDQVHQVLGRHRVGDARSGWISGLDEETGERHPTAGGLRIGKHLPERVPDEPENERVDWDRDGQYYHYLTRWMHALERSAAITGDADLLRYGVELAKAAHAAFSHRTAGEQRLYWKMSVDLSHPVVESMGQHDALDGLVAAVGLDRARSAVATAERAPELELDAEISQLAEMCRGWGWATSDLLGAGGLLADSWLLAHRPPRIGDGGDALLTRCLNDAVRSLDIISLAKSLDGPAEERLPFRELGLSLGLAAVERLDRLRADGGLPGGDESAAHVVKLVAHLPLREKIESFWASHDRQTVATWVEHEDINGVMLATSLLPEGYLG